MGLRRHKACALSQSRQETRGRGALGEHGVPGLRDSQEGVLTEENGKGVKSRTGKGKSRTSPGPRCCLAFA